MIEQINSFIDSLSLDHKRGAAEIVLDSAELFLSIAHYSRENPYSVDGLFNRAVKRLSRGQPSMAPMLNLLNRICRTKEEAGDDWEKFGVSVEGLIARRADLLNGMISQIEHLPVKPKVLVTFSNSSSVGSLVINAFQKFGWPEIVYCGEGRPVNEGLFLARKLASAGVNVILCTDAAAMSRVTEADSVWVGGDSFSRGGLVNKVGSLALAMLAKQRGIPFVSCISSNKFLSTGLMPYFKNLPQNPREIGADESEGLQVLNQYYETIPLDLVTYVLTENEISPPAKLVETISDEPVSPLLTKILAG